MMHHYPEILLDHLGLQLPQRLKAPLVTQMQLRPRESTR